MKNKVAIFLLESFKIALKFTKNLKYKKIFLSMNFFSKFGIAISVAVSIIGLSLTNGFEKEIKNKILNIIPHGEIKAVYPPYFYWKSDLKKIQKIRNIISVVPFINFFALLEKNKNITTIQIISIDSSSKESMNYLHNFELKKKLRKLKPGQKEIILGNGIANKLRVSINDFITITTPIHNNNLKKIQFKTINLKVTEIFKLNSILDNQIAYIPFKDAQEYLEYKNGISGFQIRVNDIFSIKKIMNHSQIKTNQKIIFNSWFEEYQYLYKDIKIIRIIIYITMILLIIISCFSIIFISMITVKNKSIDIAILKTLGAKKNFLFSIFLWYGLIIGFTGYSIGISIGLLILTNINKFAKLIEYFIGNNILSSNVYFVNFLPFNLNYLDLFYILSITLTLTLFFSLYPAKKSTKIDIIKILNSLKE